MQIRGQAKIMMMSGNGVNKLRGLRFEGKMGEEYGVEVRQVNKVDLE